jgi:hypothetical protein
MKIRVKQFAYSIALTGLVVAAVNVAWAAAGPSSSQTNIFYYSDASHSTVVGERTPISCLTGSPAGWGQTSAYSVTQIQKCANAPGG